jgi:cell division transport system ATP-binding protein
MIKFENVTKSYENGISSLYDVSFEIQEGEFVFLIGPSGAGKTTALRMIIREEVPSDGSIIISEYDVTTMPKRFLPSLRRQIGVIFQDFKLLPGLTVSENISFILEVSGKTDEEIAETVQYLLSVVDLADRAHLYPQQLSGGEQQRVAIARAIANDPAIVLADEPTGNLDPKNAEQVMNLLRQINGWGTTVVISTHDSVIVDQQQTRVIALEKGRLVKDYVGNYLDGLKKDVEAMQEIADHISEDMPTPKPKVKESSKIKFNVSPKTENFDEKSWEELMQKNSESLIFEKETLKDELKDLTKNKKKTKKKVKAKKPKAE